MRIVSAFVETGVGMAYDSGSAAWIFDPDLWAMCGQGPDESAALRNLDMTLEDEIDLHVAERIRGDEQAFERDREPCTEHEWAITLAILEGVREDTIAFVASCPDAELDHDDPQRSLPAFASWRTLRDMAWHIADTESRYYLPSLELPGKPRAANIADELEESAEHVRNQLWEVPADRVVENDEVWTTVKLLRRLAWHEQNELAEIRRMLANMRGGHQA